MRSADWRPLLAVPVLFAWAVVGCTKSQGTVTTAVERVPASPAAQEAAVAATPSEPAGAAASRDASLAVGTKAIVLSVPGMT